MIEDIRNTRVNWPVLLIFVIAMFVLLFYFEKAWGEERDPLAVTIAEKSINAMGGIQGWKAVAAIRFNFQVEPEGQPPRFVKHLWDRKNGRDHVEGKNKDGKWQVAWVDLHTREGKAWIENQQIEGDQLKETLEWAYARWINDTYWMIMPLKTLDAGVSLKQEGAKDGYDILHLSFSSVGLTPGDQYWAYINQITGLMDRWRYKLEDQTEGDWNWVEWQDFGKIKLSKLKKKSDGKTAIRFEPLTVMESAEPGYFAEEIKLLD